MLAMFEGSDIGLIAIGFAVAIVTLVSIGATNQQKRKKMSRVVFALLAAAGLIIGVGVARFIRVDRCLDAGGAYDYDAGACRHD